MTQLALSKEQLAIVSHPLAPLRVAAGAGTGKTTTIALRLRHAVENAGVAPEAAIGITFTNKAAEELGDRLRRELPDLADSGREVEVTTYHGFAHRILEEFGAIVGVERASLVVGPGYVRQLLLESLEEGRYERLDLTSAPQRVSDAAALARQLGDNLRSPQDLAAVEPATDVERDRAELASVLVGFEDRKRKLGVLDYSDLVRMAHRLVTEHPAIAARIRERYVLVLLDEYQDTDAAQRRLLMAIFGEGFPITAVGDSDQTIYEWRGASLANFAGFPEHFPQADGTAAVTLPLTENRRSCQLILDVANRIRREIHGEAPYDKLRPVAGTPLGVVEARYFATAVNEAEWLAGELVRLHDEDGVAWRDVAVLFRKNRQIALVRDALDAAGIPLEVVSLGGLLSVPEVSDLHAWLRILGRSDDGAALVRILLGGRYRLGLGDLGPLANWVRDRRKNQAAAGDEGGDAHGDEPGWPLIEAIDRLEEITGLSDEATARLTDFRESYRGLLQVAQGVALVELCRRILDATDAWAEIGAMEPAAALSARLNLYRLLDLAEEWSPLEGRPSLEAFLGYLDLLLDERSQEELDTARVGEEDAVSLLTVHRAKGLEWEAVFLPALSWGTFPASSLGFDNPVTRRQSLPYQLRLDSELLPSLDGSDTEVRDRLRKHHEAQEWRAAYVAVTRAKQRLYLTGAHWYTTVKSKAPSPLFELAVEVEGVTVLGIADPGDPPERLVIESTAGAPDPLFRAEGWRSALRRAIDDPTWPERAAGEARQSYDARMDQLEIMLEGLPTPASDGSVVEPVATSVTGLVTYATCPKRFYWSAIDPLPRRPSRARARGVEVHRRIELHNRGIVPLDELEDGLYDLGPSEGHDEGGGDATATTKAYDVFLASRFGAVKPRFTETPIDLVIAGARIRGRIDAIYEPAESEWEIVDFKSGAASSNPARQVQLQAYAVAAVDGAVAVDRPKQLDVTFAYLGKGKLTEETQRVDERWLDDARTSVEGILDGITAGVGDGGFEPAPSDACHSCDFLRFCEQGKAYLDSL